MNQNSNVIVIGASVVAVLIAILALFVAWNAGGDSGSLSGQSHTNSGLVINEDGTDDDSRIESDGNENMFFVDAGTNRIGIGDATPDFTFDIETTNTATSTLQVGCIQMTATTTANPIKLVPASYATTTATFGSNTTGLPAVFVFGTCP